MKLVSGTGRITLDNTMEERLRLLEDKARPCSHNCTLPSNKYCLYSIPPFRPIASPHFADAARDQKGPLREEPQSQILYINWPPRHDFMDQLYITTT